MIVDYLPTWDDGDKLLAEINFLIYRRYEKRIDENKLPKNYVIINTTFIA